MTAVFTVCGFRFVLSVDCLSTMGGLMRTPICRDIIASDAAVVWRGVAALSCPTRFKNTTLFTNTTATTTTTTTTTATTTKVAMDTVAFIAVTDELSTIPSFLDTFEKLGDGCCEIIEGASQPDALIVDSLQACKDACSANKACSAFELTKQKTDKRCQLYFDAPLGVVAGCSKQCWKRDESVQRLRRSVNGTATDMQMDNTFSFTSFSQTLVVCVAAATLAILLLVFAAAVNIREMHTAPYTEFHTATATIV